MRTTVTQRGFIRKEFIDTYGKKCSLQKSSVSEKDCVFLGIDDPDVKVLASRHPELTTQTTGWIDVPLPIDVLIVGRMHLDQHTARQLIEALQQFVATGELA